MAAFRCVKQSLRDLQNIDLFSSFIRVFRIDYPMCIQTRSKIAYYSTNFWGEKVSFSLKMNIFPQLSEIVKV